MGVGRARVIVGFAAFGAFWGTWGAVLPQVQAHARVDDAALGSALVWIGIGALGSIRLVGGLADRYGRAVLTCSFAALGVAAALPSFVSGAAGLSVALFAVGLASGAVDAAINAAGTHVEGAGTPTLNLGHGAFSVAVVVASLSVAALIRSSSGPPWALVAVGVVLVLSGIATALMRSVRPKAPTRAERARRWSWSLVVIGGLAAVAYLVENAWQSWGAIQLHSTLGASLRVAALAPAVFAGCAATGRFAGHALARQVGSAAMLGAGACLAAAGSIVGALARPAPVALVGIAVAGLGTSICAPTLISIAGRRSPSAPGAATGTVITLAYLGFVFGPAIVGLIAGSSTLPVALVVVAVAAAALGAASPVIARLDRVPSPDR